MTCQRISAFAAVLCLAVIVPAAAGPKTAGPEGAAFYTPPSPLPKGERGSVVWTRAFEGTMALPSASRNVLTLYRSTDAQGKIVPVTGTVSIPPGEAPRGGWSLERYGFDNSIPTLAESIPGLEVTWSAVFITPANVPENIRKKLADELIAITKEPAIIERLKTLSVTPASLSGADLEKNIAADYEKWRPIVERAKIPQP